MKMVNGKQEKTRLQVRLTLFADYVCPFCFIGDLRLQQLRKDYDVLVNFRFIEIHPETPAQGATVDSLDYSDEQWQGMMDGLLEMAAEDHVSLKTPRLLVNSHHALLLAEAAKSAGRETFYKLNQALYFGYFIEGRNIGDRDVLREIATDCGISEELAEKAWSDPEYEKILQTNMAMAVKAGVTGTPTFFIGQQRFTGAVAANRLKEAAVAYLQSHEEN